MVSSRASLTSEQKLEFARQLERLNVDIIALASWAFSLHDFAAVQQIAREIKGRVVTGLARAVAEDIDILWEAVKVAEAPRMHTFLSTSDIHLEKQFRMTREQGKERAVAMVARASRTARTSSSRRWTPRSDWDYLYEVIEAVEAVDQHCRHGRVRDAGRVRRADLRRLGQSQNADAVISLRRLGYGRRQLAGSDQGLRVRWRGASTASASTGNASLEEVIMALQGPQDFYKGFDTQIDAAKCHAVHGPGAAANKAIIGKNAFAHESGIHQDGVLKDTTTYEIMTPLSVGRAESKLVMGKHSGATRCGWSPKIGYVVGTYDSLEAFPGLQERRRSQEGGLRGRSPRDHGVAAVGHRRSNTLSLRFTSQKARPSPDPPRAGERCGGGRLCPRRWPRRPERPGGRGPRSRVAVAPRRESEAQCRASNRQPRCGRRFTRVIPDPDLDPQPSACAHLNATIPRTRTARALAQPPDRRRGGGGLVPPAVDRRVPAASGDACPDPGGCPLPSGHGGRPWSWVAITTASAWIVLVAELLSAGWLLGQPGGWLGGGAALAIAGPWLPARPLSSPQAHAHEGAAPAPGMGALSWLPAHQVGRLDSAGDRAPLGAVFFLTWFTGNVGDSLAAYLPRSVRYLQNGTFAIYDTNYNFMPLFTRRWSPSSCCSSDRTRSWSRCRSRWPRRSASSRSVEAWAGPPLAAALLPWMMPAFLLHASTSNFDILTGFWLLLALYLRRGYAATDPRWLAAAALATGLAVATKPTPRSAAPALGLVLGVHAAPGASTSPSGTHGADPH